MRPRIGHCRACKQRLPLRRFWRRGTVRWHDLLDAEVGSVHRCSGAGRLPWGAS